MQLNVVWFVVSGGSALGVAGAVHVVKYGAFELPHSSWRRKLAIGGTCILLLLLLAALAHIREVSRLDGNVVADLLPGRSPVLSSVLTIITTMGDVVPSFILASGLSLALYQYTNRWFAWLIPPVVILEIAIQTGLPKVFHDLTIADVHPNVPLGSAGPIPSGSVARLFAIVMVAAIIARHQSRRVARAIIILGPVTVLVEIATRLYLGRHLLIDIVGGLVLGILLALLTAWLLDAAHPTGWTRSGVTGPGTAQTVETTHGTNRT